MIEFSEITKAVKGWVLAVVAVAFAGIGTLMWNSWGWVPRPAYQAEHPITVPELQTTLDGILEGQRAANAKIDALAIQQTTQHRHWECDELIEEIPGAILDVQTSEGLTKAEAQQRLNALQDKFDDLDCNRFVD